VAGIPETIDKPTVDDSTLTCLPEGPEVDGKPGGQKLACSITPVKRFVAAGSASEIYVGSGQRRPTDRWRLAPVACWEHPMSIGSQAYSPPAERHAQRWRMFGRGCQYRGGGFCGPEGNICCISQSLKIGR
jgi:hypothetical protein